MGKEDTLYDKEGKAVECIIKKVPVIVEEKIIGAYVIYNDISQQKKREEDILYLNYHDNLTGLYNRVYLEAEIASLEVNKESPICILMLDLNGLKLINDSYGHRIGDKLLIRTADVLKNIFRKKDIIARWGGDEFVILLTKTEETKIESLIKRIKNLDQKVVIENGNQIPLSLAVGWAFKDDDTTDVYDLLPEAENMMYKNKLLEDKSMKSHLVESLLSTLKQKSQETTEHAKRMSSLAIKLGKRIGLPKSELNRLSLIAVLHDIGKTIIPEKILNKDGQLTAEEWQIIKEHPATGYRICSEVEEFSHVANEILTHHEHWNGEGYPQGLKGKEIPVLSRIISIVDAYDVMTNDRTYRKAVSKKEAIKELKKFAGKQFDPELVKEFVHISEQI
ncbi:MAG: HD domain-containing phosphohydrolase [Halanaerobium sp.]